MYGCEGWTIKKAEHQRTDAFELGCWRTLLSPLDCKESNQSILKEISPGSSLEGLMLKLKLQYFGHMMRRTDAFEQWCWRRILRPVHPKGDQSWVFIGRTDAESETPILCHLMQRVDSLEKTLMLGEIGGRRRRR